MEHPHNGISEAFQNHFLNKIFIDFVTKLNVAWINREKLVILVLNPQTYILSI